jgi:hypothetical protein
MHGYFLQRVGGGEFLRIYGGDRLMEWVDDIRVATNYPHRRLAQNAAYALMMNAGPVVEIVERTIPDEPPADANPEDKIARSREEVQAELKKQAAEYFAKYGHKVPLRRKGRAYGVGGFGGGRNPFDEGRAPFVSLAHAAGAYGEVDDPSLGKASELNAPTPSDTRTTSPSAPPRPQWPTGRTP